MVSVKGSFTTAAPKTKPPQYHAVVSHALQKQFVHACVWTLITCYIVSYSAGHKHGIWELFPWSWTGVRAIALFLALFPLLMIRKANLHLIVTTRSSLILTLLSKSMTRTAVLTWVAYTFSSFVFFYLYINNCSSVNGLTMLLTQKSYELPRLNERWIYIYFLAFWMGLMATLWHTIADIDLISVPAIKLPIPARLKQSFMPVVFKAALMSSIAILTCPIAYVFVRGVLYQNILVVARLFFRLPKSNSQPSWPVGSDLLRHSFVVTFLITLLWLSVNLYFSIYLSQAPIRKGRLVSEKSMQPNETLATGLQHESKQLTQHLAFEELELIATHYVDRRVKIFETGSPEATLWLSIVAACLKPVTDLSREVVEFLNAGVPKQNPAQPAPAAARSVPAGASPIHVQNGNIFKPGNHKQTTVDRLKSQPATIPAPSAKGQQAINSIIEHSRSYLKTSLNFLHQYFPVNHTAKFERTNFRLFRNKGVVSMAITSLTHLFLRSMDEDTYGRVHKDVLRVLVEVSALINYLDIYLQRHGQSINCKEATALKHQLEASLGAVGHSFSPYIDLSSQPAVQARIKALQVVS